MVTLTDPVKKALLRATGTSLLAEAAKALDRDPARLVDAAEMLCNDAKRELETERARENRMETAFEAFFYATIVLVIVSVILILLGRVTEAIASGATSIITGGAGVWIYARLKDQRELVEKKIGQVKEYCLKHEIARGMLSRRIGSSDIVRAMFPG